MNPSVPTLPPAPPEPGEVTSLLILEDGRVMARNVTPAIAALLRTLCPEDSELGSRTACCFPPQPNLASDPSTHEF